MAQLAVIDHGGTGPPGVQELEQAQIGPQDHSPWVKILTIARAFGDRLLHILAPPPAGELIQ